MQDIAYTAFDQPDNITQGTKKLKFTYGLSLSRVKSVYSESNVIKETRYYLGDYEIQQIGDTTREIHYINASTGLVAMVVKENNEYNYYYTATDHLGSITTVMDEEGEVVAEQSFDAWGRRRNANSWSTDSTSVVPTWLYRGYTGHEMLDSFQLINMNGRLYDPVIARMLSPDPFVQAPNSLQSYNRYTYVFNNPLSYTDPSGYKGKFLNFLSKIFNSDQEAGGAGGVTLGDRPDGISTGVWEMVKGVVKDNNSKGGSGMYTFSNGQLTGSINNAVVTLKNGVVTFSGNYTTMERISRSELMSYGATFDGDNPMPNNSWSVLLFNNECYIPYFSNLSVFSVNGNEEQNSASNLFSDAYNSTLGRSLIPDIISIGFGFSGIAGIGAGSSAELNWITRGPEASLKPVITVTQQVGAGYAIDATINLGAVRFSGSVDDITRSMVVTNTTENGDIPTLWGSGAVSAAFNIGATGTYTPLDKGYLSGGQINFGAGLPAGPLPINGAGGLSNTWVIYDFGK